MAGLSRFLHEGIRRVFVGRLLLSVLAVCVCLGGLEFLLRSVPALVPKGAFYGSGVYDEDLGFRLPATRVIYNKVRYVEREPNPDGFMDVEHQVTKPPGIVRVGFFGDSYVESVQVPLRDVFFRRLPSRIGGVAIEPFGFGISGLGTLHSLELYRKFGRRYDLDVVVYVFVNNDPGDQLSVVQRVRPGFFAARPTATPNADRKGYEVHRFTSVDSDSPFRRLASWTKDRSLLARVVYARIQLLSRRTPGGGEVLSAEDPPSKWPAEVRRDAEILMRRVLATWRDELRSEGRQFVILYVPRSDELVADLGADSWRGWLLQTAVALEIPVVDPSQALAEQERHGDPAYDDHWTRAGHEAVAAALEGALRSAVGGNSES